MENTITTAPGSHLQSSKMPGHWVLARLGKKVLRPGGLDLTRKMLGHLSIDDNDDVVEFAPGLGVTARMTLERRPASYTAVERDADAASQVELYLTGETQKCITASAESTGLPDDSFTAVYGEAMLTMQSDAVKRKIVQEASRILRPGGRYGIHEMCLRSDVDSSSRKEIHKALTGVVHHGVRPMTVEEWKNLLESEGFDVQVVETAPMALLEPARLIRDEGLRGALRFLFRALRDPDARRRVLNMRRVFRARRHDIAAVAMIAVRRRP
ncbi:MAG: methyltransferase domain-containing protein [Thermoanaerobaculia bacterium]|nr:methyltransferase domain-containing protein [Thermoanaerobaculia bacterium]